MKNIIIFLLGCVVVGTMLMSFAYAAFTFTTKGTFTTQDVIDTNLSKETVSATVVSNTLEDDVFDLIYSIPSLQALGDDYEIYAREYTHTINLESQYNDCRNGGETKEQCVAGIKTGIVDYIDLAKNRAMQASIALQESLLIVDYTDEISLEDLQLATEDIN